jgi:Zinc carboxypeptidase
MNHLCTVNLGFKQALRSGRVGALGAWFGILVCSGLAQAQFDPARVALEPEAIARQFADPATPFNTPAFLPGRQDFTSHAEVFGFLDALSRRTPGLVIETLGRSQQGRAMVAVVLTGPRGWDPQLPTVLLLGQQHGNEPAGGEAALVMAQTLAGERSTLLKRVNVLYAHRPAALTSTATTCWCAHLNCRPSPPPCCATHRR